ncbi:MAG: hypothetical protein ACREDH_12280 [Methylocella sp.]
MLGAGDPGRVQIIAASFEGGAAIARAAMPEAFGGGLGAPPALSP